MMEVPVTGQVVTPEMRSSLAHFILSQQDIAHGPHNEQFEEAFAKYIGVRRAFFVNSGSSANLLALSAFMSPQMHELWRARPGDEIITIAAAFPTTVAPIVQNGLIPVFVDVDRSLNIDVSMLETAYSPEKTRGVMIAHTLGNPFNVSAVKTFCDKHSLFLIEDCCDALDSTWEGTKVGSFGDVSTFSFYPAHHMTTGQGGMVCTKDIMTHRILLSLRNWGRDCVCAPGEDGICGMRFSRQLGDLPYGYDHKYVFSHFGYNLQATQFQAYLGLLQLAQMPSFTQRRKEVFNRIHTAMQEISVHSQAFSFPFVDARASPSWFGYPIMLSSEIDRRKVLLQLEEAGVRTRLLFAGDIVRQPMFADNPDVAYSRHGSYIMTEKIMNNFFWVGAWHGLSDEQVDYEIHTLKEVLEAL